MNLGGARPTLFNVQLTFPTGVSGAAAGRKFEFTCEATELPASSLGMIPVPYFGRIIKYAGDRTFAPWSVTVVNDEDFVVRDALESWSSLMNTRVSNLRDTATSNANEYKTSAQVTQYGRTGEILRKYTMQGLWPRDVESIALAWGEMDQIEKFRTVFEFDWFDIEGPTGQGGRRS